MSGVAREQAVAVKGTAVVKFYCERIQSVHIINSGSEHDVLTSSLGVLCGHVVLGLIGDRPAERKHVHPRHSNGCLTILTIVYGEGA